MMLNIKIILDKRFVSCKILTRPKLNLTLEDNIFTYLPPKMGHKITTYESFGFLFCCKSDVAYIKIIHTFYHQNRRHY